MTVSAAHVEATDLSDVARRRAPRYPLLVLRLARLAVDLRAQKRGIGERLLRFVFELAEAMSERLGCVGIVVDAKPETILFYERYGFERREIAQGDLGDRPRPTPMFLALAEIPRPA